MGIDRRSFLSLGGAALIGSAVRGQTGRYTLDAIPAGQALKDAGGNVVFSYLTSKPEGVPLAGNSVCCVHPFNTLGGEPATDIAPADHRDHRGIFFAWHDMSFTKGGQTLKGDFWGWGAHAPTDGRVITNREIRLADAGPNHGEIALVNDWIIGSDRVMQEETRIRAGIEEGLRVLDLRFSFRSDYDVTVSQMAFTGFCFRCRKEGPYTFFNTDGEVTPDRFPNSNANRPDTDWPAKSWYSHVVTLPNGKVVSSAVIDHPANPPSLWHGARGVSFLNPCISAGGPVTRPAGTPLLLRYRAIAHDGRFADGVLDRMAIDWRSKF